jgi:hypothetical protein
MRNLRRRGVKSPTDQPQLKTSETITPPPHEGEGRLPRAWRSKWRYVAVFWAAQAVATHLATAAFLATDKTSFSFDDFWGALSNWGVLAVSGSVSAFISIMQAVLLFPIRRPREHELHPGLRFLHCAAVALVMAALSWLMLWPLTYFLHEILHHGEWLADFMNRPSSLSVPFAVLGITLVAMWHFGRDGIPAIVSAMIAAACAAALLGGIAVLLWSIPRVIETPPTPSGVNPYERATFGSACGALLIGWVLGTILILAFMRHGIAEEKIAWLSSRLFLGTIVEAAAAIPMDVMVRKRSDCHCGEGTFWTLALCWAVGTLTLGPIVFLVPFSRRRKRWYAGHCEICGYDMTGCKTADRCPECGTGWKPTKTETTSGC